MSLTFEQLQQQFLGRKKDNVLPVVIRVRYMDTSDPERPVVKMDETETPFFVRKWSVTKRQALLKEIREKGDAELIMDKIVRDSLSDENGKLLLDKSWKPEDEEADSLVMAAFDAAMVHNGFRLAERKNPATGQPPEDETEKNVATIVKN